MAGIVDLGIDMNIDNYSLTDLLSLFHLDYNFSGDDLKKAKMTVLMTHPDKSSLNKEYFLFFSAAYKIVYAIHDFRNKNEQKPGHQKYNYEVEKDEATEKLLAKMKGNANFNQIFNELFEKHKVQDEETAAGYGDWLISNENIDTRTTSLAQMNETFEQKKKEVQQAIVRRLEVEELGGSGGSGGFELAGDKPEYFSSGVFSNNLAYEDLKKAHVESVVPVTYDDYLNKPAFKNVDEMRRYNAENSEKPLSLQQANEYLAQQRDSQSKTDVQRAFKLAKQSEVARKANMGWMSGFKQLL